MANIREYAKNAHAGKAWTTTNKGNCISVSIEDYDLVENHTWSDSPCGKYARSTIKGSMTALHRVVAERMGLDIHFQSDVVDGNFFNCCRSNILQTSKFSAHYKGFN